MDEMETIQIQVDEILNNLMFRPDIEARRMGQVWFVQDRLRGRVLDKWARTGITPEMERLFSSQETPKEAKANLLERFQEAALALGLSQRSVREFRRIAKLDGAFGLEELKQMLLEKELIDFRKETGLSPRVWLAFLHCRAIPGEATMDKICRALDLEEEDKNAFFSLVIRTVFPVTEVLHQAVRNHLKETGEATMAFYHRAGIGKEAWEPFYGEKPDEETVRNTSQGTLLKMVIGFALEEPGAWDFMEKAESTFVVRRDLVFLACVRLRYVEPGLVDRIVDRFGKDDQGNVYFHNPYEGAFT